MYKQKDHFRKDRGGYRGNKHRPHKDNNEHPSHKYYMFLASINNLINLFCTTNYATELKQLFPVLNANAINLSHYAFKKELEAIIESIQQALCQYYLLELCDADNYSKLNDIIARIKQLLKMVSGNDEGVVSFAHSQPVPEENKEADVAPVAKALDVPSGVISEWDTEVKKQADKIVNQNKSALNEVILSNIKELIQELKAKYETFEKSYSCPIGLTILKEPVILVEDSQTYEKNAILEWLKIKGISPFTKKRITNPQNPSMIVNYSIKGVMDTSRKEIADLTKKIQEKLGNAQDGCLKEKHTTAIFLQLFSEFNELKSLPLE